jgi:hypothetical protein
MLQSAVERATAQSIEGVIDSVAADSIAEALDARGLQPEHLSFDEVALATAAYRALAEIDLALREEAMTDLAATAPGIVRLSKAGDMTSVPLARLEELAAGRDLSGLTRLPGFGSAQRVAPFQGPIRIGLDARAVARLAMAIEIKTTISMSIATAMEGELHDRTQGLLEAIRGYLVVFGLRRTTRYVRDLIRDLAGHGTAALVEHGIPTWEAYVMIGESVAIACASVYCAATRPEEDRETAG